ncbi:TadE-like protein [Caballeronia catudaia]|uniref:TadE-like protein n=1 Tax=Caballeronia catudaia TaxID=1777136 RepID=A0A158B957_9BURK|nr:TadE/TadG family type IV pilus assembly protein [Caballeronia catudaia]SAK66618.1 TadE-like protein [Caballeronia catudaia]
MKTACETARAIRKKLGRLLRSERGSVSIEFVIIVPMMLLVMLGFTEVYMYMRAASAVDRTAFTLANSIGQMSTVIADANDTTNANSYGSLWQDAALLAAPYPIKADGMVYVTSVCDTPSSGCLPMSASNPMAAGSAGVRWNASTTSWANNKNSLMTSRVSSTNPLPSTWPFRTGDSAIIVEVFLAYNPFTMSSKLISGLPGEQIVYRRVYVRPRSGQPLTKQ